MYEELMTEDEALYAVEYEDMFCIRPMMKPVSQETERKIQSYSSSMEALLSLKEIQDMLAGTSAE